MIRLMFERRGVPGQVPEVRAFDRAVVWIGREVKASDPAREAVWVLPYPDVSREQCKLEDSGDAVCVEPLSTRSATFVNGQRIEGVTRLMPGDSIRFGDCRLRFVAEVVAPVPEVERDKLEKRGEIRDLAQQQRAAQVERPGSVIGGAAVVTGRVTESEPRKGAAPEGVMANVPEDMSPVVAAAQRWDELGRPASELLRDPGLLGRGRGWLRGGAVLGGAAALVRTYVEASVQARRAGWQQRGLVGAWLVGAVVAGSVTARVFAGEVVFGPLVVRGSRGPVECKKEVISLADSVAQAAEQESDDRAALLVSALAVQVAEEGGCLAESRAERQLRRQLAGQRSQHLGDLDDAVAKVAVNSSGSRAATIDAAGKVRVWNLESRDARELEVKASTVQWSRDGAWLVVGGAAGEVALFDAGGWPLERKVQAPGHRGKVTVLVVSAASDVFVTGDERGELKLWSLQGEALDRPLAAKSVGSEIEEAAFDGKSRRLFTLAGGRVRIWSLEGKRLAEQRVLAAEGVRAMAVSPAGDEVLTGDKDGIVNLWDVKQGRGRPAHDPFDAAIVAVAFVPERAALIATADRKLVHLDLRKAQPGRTLFDAHRFDDMAEAPRDLVVEGQRAVTVGAKGQPEVWDLVELTKQPTVRLDGHSEVRAMAAADQRSILITGDARGAVRKWEILGESVEGAHVLGTRGREVRDVALDPKGVLLASADASGAVRVWKTEGEGAPTDLGELPSIGPVSRVAVNADATWVAGVGDGMIVVWNVDLKGPPLSGAHPMAQWVAWSTVGDVLVSAGRDQIVREWAIEGDSLKPTAAVRNVGGEVEKLAVSDKRTAVSVRHGDSERELHVWPLREAGAALPEKLVGESAATRALVFDLTGTRLAAGYANGMTRTWLLEGDEPQATRVYDTSAVTALSFAVTGELGIGEEKGQVRVINPDEKGGSAQIRGTYKTPVVGSTFGASSEVLVSAAREGRMVLRRRDTEIDLVGHRKSVSLLLGHPNGHFVVSASGDEALRVWPLQATGLVQLACLTAGRDLRAEEWSRLPQVKPRELCPNLPGV